MDFKLKVFAAKDDPEKLILPGMVWCFREYEEARGFIVAIGWWHWGVSLSVLWIGD